MRAGIMVGEEYKNVTCIMRDRGETWEDFAQYLRDIAANSSDGIATFYCDNDSEGLVVSHLYTGEHQEPRIVPRA